MPLILHSPLLRYFLALFLLAGRMAFSLSAQQDYQFTQFNFNKLALNPAYAGSDNLISLTSLYRRQWSGLEGAPQTISFAAHAPVFHNRVGLGLLVYDDRLGVSKDLGIYTAYTYRIPLGGSVLSLGLQAGVLNFRTAYTELTPLTPGDVAFSQDVQKLLPNAGFGVYWTIPQRAYVGLSIPRLIENQLPESIPGLNESARLNRHSYLMAGYVLPVNSSLKLRPSGLIKYAGPGTQSAPISGELNLSALLVDRIWLGASWRSSDALGAMAEVLITPQFTMGYAYDFGISALSDLHGGSHEIMLRYEFIANSQSAVTPRKIKYF